MSIWFKRNSTQNASSISRPDSVYEIMGFLTDAMTGWSHGCLGGDEYILCLGKIWIIWARGWNMVGCYRNRTQWIIPSSKDTLIRSSASWDLLLPWNISKCNAGRGLISICNCVLSCWNIADTMWGTPYPRKLFKIQKTACREISSYLRCLTWGDPSANILTVCTCMNESSWRQQKNNQATS